VIAVISRGGDATRRQLGLAQEYENLTAGRLGDDDGRRPARRLPHGVELIVRWYVSKGTPSDERLAFHSGRPRNAPWVMSHSEQWVCPSTRPTA